MRGFTLIETVVVIGLAFGVTVTLAGLLVFFYRTNASILEQAGAITSARRGIESAMRDVREATYAENGAYPIEAIGEDSLTFYADVDVDNSVERIRYTLEESILYRNVVEASGDPLAYSGVGATTTISTDVRNDQFDRPVFQYFGSLGQEVAATSSPLDVRFVTAEIVVNINPDRAPTEFTLTSSATLRNVRD